MKRCVFLLLLVLVASGCSKKRPRAQLPPPPQPATHHPKAARSAPAPIPTVDELYGYASWYGHPYHGRRTASGEVYDMNSRTAAHRTLAMGTHVEVTNMENGRQVKVRINDRGPFVEGRVIDLSYSAAQAIDIIGPGTALVRLSVLGEEGQAGPGAAGRYGVQVGVFHEKRNADRLQGLLARRHAPVNIRQDGDLYRVLVGAEKTEAAANSLADRLRQEHLLGIVVLMR